MRPFVKSFLSGLATLAAIWPPAVAVRYSHISAEEALRADGVKIGQDMQRALDREKSSVKA